MNKNRLQLNQLRNYFVSQLPNKVTAIESTWQDYLHQPSHEILQVLYRQAHNLSGSAGTYGYKEVNEAAKKMDKLLRENRNLDYEHKAKITALIDRLKVICNKIR